MSVQTEPALEQEGGPPPLAEGPVNDPGLGPEDHRHEEGLDVKPERERDEESVEDILEPKIEPIERLIGPDEKGHTGTYIQRELMWFGQIELYGILGRAVKIVMSGEGGLGLDELMGMSRPKDMFDQILAHQPGADTAPDAEDHKQSVDATQVLAAFARVVSVAPELLADFYCVALAAPKGHRPWLIDWGLPTIPSEMGQDILETFIDQNWGAIEDFFTQELPKLARRTVQARARAQAKSGDRSRR